MRVKGEFGAPGPTLLKTGGGPAARHGDKDLLGARGLSPGNRPGGQVAKGGETGVRGGGRWRDGHPRRLPGKPGRRSCRQHGDRGSGGLMFNWSSGSPAVPLTGSWRVARSGGGVGCPQLFHYPSRASPPPQYLPAPGLPMTASCWKWRGWRDGEEALGGSKGLRASILQVHLAQQG